MKQSPDCEFPVMIILLLISYPETLKIRANLARQRSSHGGHPRKLWVHYVVGQRDKSGLSELQDGGRHRCRDYLPSRGEASLDGGIRRLGGREIVNGKADRRILG